MAIRHDGYQTVARPNKVCDPMLYQQSYYQQRSISGFVRVYIWVIGKMQLIHPC